MNGTERSKLQKIKYTLEDYNGMLNKMRLEKEKTFYKLPEYVQTGSIGKQLWQDIDVLEETQLKMEEIINLIGDIT